MTENVESDEESLFQELAPGAKVANRYVVEQRVAKGNFGEVWRALDTSTGSAVALKKLVAEAVRDRTLVARFRREALLLSRVDSPNVAKVIEFVVKDRPFGTILVMQFIEGRSLGDILHDRTLSVEEAIDVATDILVGVKDLHAVRVIHRDLKPANVIVRSEPDGRLRATICDVGLGRLANQPRPKDDDEGPPPSSYSAVTNADETVGTLKYMAPEQVLDSREVTGQADIYSVGAILYRAVAGVHAFDDSTSERNFARAKLTGEAQPLNLGRHDLVAREFEALVARALRRFPSERFKDAEEMLAELQEIRGLALIPSTDFEADMEALGPPDSNSSQSARIARSRLRNALPPDSSSSRRGLLSPSGEQREPRVELAPHVTHLVSMDPSAPSQREIPTDRPPRNSSSSRETVPGLRYEPRPLTHSAVFWLMTFGAFATGTAFGVVWTRYGSEKAPISAVMMSSITEVLPAIREAAKRFAVEPVAPERLLAPPASSSSSSSAPKAFEDLPATKPLAAPTASTEGPYTTLPEGNKGADTEKWQ